MALIRRAARQDLPHLAQLLGRDTDWARYLAPRLGRADSAIQVAEQDGRLVGYSAVRLVRRGQRGAGSRLPSVVRRLLHRCPLDPDAILQPKRFGYIDEVGVPSELQRQGVGEALVQSSIQWLASQSIDEVQTAIRLPGGEAQAFFQGLGFEPLRFLVRKTVGFEQGANDNDTGAGINQGRQAEVTIRPAEREDLAPLAELFRREIETQHKLAGYFQGIPDVDWAAFILTRLRHRDAAVRVAERNGRLVGYLLARFLRQGRSARCSWLTTLVRRRARRGARRRPAERYGLIEDVYVLPAQREQGIATALVQRGLDWFQSQGVTQVRAMIWEGNVASRCFFEKLGFEPIRLMMRKWLRPVGEG